MACSFEENQLWKRDFLLEVGAISMGTWLWCLIVNCGCCISGCNEGFCVSGFCKECCIGFNVIVKFCWNGCCSGSC